MTRYLISDANTPPPTFKVYNTYPPLPPIAFPIPPLPFRYRFKYLHPPKSKFDMKMVPLVVFEYADGSGVVFVRLDVRYVVASRGV